MNAGVWDLFAEQQQAQIIIGQLIRITSKEDVAQQLGVTMEKIDFSQQKPFHVDVLQNISNLSFENWELTRNKQPILIPYINKRIQATYDFKAIPGNGCASTPRALLHTNGKYKALYGSSDREEGHIPPDVNILTAQQKKHLTQFEPAVGVFKSANPEVTPQKTSKLMSELSIQSSPLPGTGVSIDATEPPTISWACSNSQNHALP